MNTFNKYTISLWLHDSRRPAITCPRQSSSFLDSRMLGCLFTPSTSVHILTSLASMSLGTHFPILLCQTNRQFLSLCDVSVTQVVCRNETVRVHRRSYVKIQNAFDIALFFVFSFQCNLFFNKYKHVRNVVHDFLVFLFIIIGARTAVVSLFLC
jgi:hypothetical protein